MSPVQSARDAIKGFWNEGAGKLMFHRDVNGVNLGGFLAMSGDAHVYILEHEGLETRLTGGEMIWVRLL